jgi:hypothetical protein
MKRLIALCLIALGIAVSQVSVKAQATGPQTGPLIPPPPRSSFPEIERVPTTSSAHNRYPPTREERVIQKGILAPSESDVARHQFLLSQKKTGLMRLLPRENFDWEVYKVPKQVDMRGGGAFFSFHYRSHEYGWGSDISYDQGKLSVGFAGADYGMITDLGDTPLESIVAEDSRALYLLYYEPPGKERDARSEARKFGVYAGVRVDGVLYGKYTEAQLNHAYLLRSIVYERSDVLVALRIVSINEDGGLTIAWKILKEFSPTKLIRDEASLRRHH